MHNYSLILSSIYYSSFYVRNLALEVPSALLLQPLRIAYFEGPSYFGIGGWSGMPAEDICSQITLVPSHVWRSDYRNCEELLERKFRTFVVAIGVISYATLLYKVLMYIWFRYLIIGPIVHELRNLRLR